MNSIYLKEADESTVTIDAEVTETVNDILAGVRKGGDEGVRDYTRTFDDVERDEIRVSAEEIDTARDTLDVAEKQAIDYMNISSRN